MTKAAGPTLRSLCPPTTSTSHQDSPASQAVPDVQLAPEQVRYHFLSRNLVQTWIRTQRGKPSYQLSQLAHRLNVA